MSGDTYSWIGSTFLPTWNTPSDWADITQGETPSPTVPGNLDTVLFYNNAINVSGSAAAAIFNQITFLGGTIDAGQATAVGYLDMWSGQLNVGSVLQLGMGSVWTNVDVRDKVVVSAPTVIQAAGAIALFGTQGPGSGGTLYTANLVMGGDVDVDANSTFEVGNGHSAVAGAITIDSGYTIAGTGQLVGTVVDNGLIQSSNLEFWLYNATYDVSGTGRVEVLSGGTLYSTDTFLSSGLTIQLDGNASFTNAGSVQSGDTLIMNGTHNTLTVRGEIDATIYGFNSTDTVLVDWPGTVSFSSFDGWTLELASSSGGTVSLNFGDLTAADTWTVGPYLGVPPYGSQVISLAVACFGAGTHIATPSGSIAVEHLRAGDRVLTISGDEQTIKWVGRRELDCRRHPTPDCVRPVRILPHAFAENRPSRPLLLSPDHAVFYRGTLIPIKYLVNGVTITQIDAGIITYYHVELARHDVIFAENLPAETYLETGCRNSFENGGQVMDLHANFTPQSNDAALIWEALAYAPLVVSGPELEWVRRHLTARAASLNPMRDSSAKSQKDVAGEQIARKSNRPLDNGGPRRSAVR